MLYKTIRELQADLTAKKYSAVELAKEYLQRIKKYESKLNSFITVTEDYALNQAKAADQRIAAGETTPLTGIPIAHKDLFCTRGIKTTCGSKMLHNFVAPYESTVTEKLANAGMVMLGKTNMDEFAMGSSTEHSYFGPTHNPWNLLCAPGGSSGGSAAAVAARLAPIATGTDTGGSIRQPASLCGITGLKPTYSRVSRFGMVAFASSLDQAGLFANFAEDIAVVLNHMAGFDLKDSTSSNKPVLDYSAFLNDSLKGLKIGLPIEYLKDLSAPIALKIDAAITELEKLGAKTQEIHLPNTDLANSAYYVIAPAECSSNLARFDGVRYGYRCENPVNLEDLYVRTRTEGFGEEVKRRLMIGTYVLSSGYYDAYYLKAQRVRHLISDDFRKAFSKVDIILGPTSPSCAFTLGEKIADPVTMYLSDIYTIAISLAGLPALSMPVGFIEGMPIGAQLIGNYFEEARILNVAHQYQQITAWHKQIPEGF